MLNFLKDLCSNPDNHLFGIYFSLDDSKKIVIPRIVAMEQKIPISVTAKPMRYQKAINEGDEKSVIYQEYLDKRVKGLEMLKKSKTYFKIVDSTDVTCAEEMFSYMKALQEYVKSIDERNNIIVAIDALDDIRFSTKKFGTTTDRHAETAKTVKSWAIQLHIPIFGSRHISKTRNGRCVIEDLKDSNEYEFEANLIFLIHNDVSKTKQAAQIFYTSAGSQEKLPVLEINWAKNKVSSYKGYSFCYFIPNYSLVTECDENDNERFNSIIYSLL